MTTNCSNNYGPYQFPEKLVPLIILNCLQGKLLPVYGDGGQIRDWLYAPDHCRAIRTVLKGGRCGEVYNLGGGRANSCSILEAFDRVEQLSGRKMAWSYVEANREGDHICYISDLAKIQAHYPHWRLDKSLDDIFTEIVRGWSER